MYYFINWRHTEEGYKPDLPEDVHFRMLAEPGRASDGVGFALFECDLPEEFEKADSIRKVSDELSELLDSAKDYPPALALARDESKSNNICSEAEYAKMLSGHLTHHLEKQINSQFFLAKANSSEIGYRYAGGYYWILGCKDDIVQWVSRDYHVYQDSADEFELNLDEVKKQFENEK